MGGTFSAHTDLAETAQLKALLFQTKMELSKAEKERDAFKFAPKEQSHVIKSDCKEIQEQTKALSIALQAKELQVAQLQKDLRRYKVLVEDVRGKLRRKS